MNWTWAAAAGAALSVAAAGSAGAKTYVVTLHAETSQFLDGSYDAGFTPFQFQQTWRTGLFSGGEIHFVEDETGIDVAPIEDVTTASGGGPATLAVDGFTAGFLTGAGIAHSGDLDGSYEVSHLIRDYPGGGLPREESAYAAFNVDLGGPHVFRLGLDATPASPPPLTGPLTEADFDALMLGAPGRFELIACGAEACAADVGPAYFRHYYGTFTTSLATAPEPAAWALMLAGFGLAGAGLRRRRLAA
jgi:hypothetical protein